MRKLPKKIYLEPDLAAAIEDISKHYDLSQSVLIEELIIVTLFPERFSLHLTLLQNDDYFKERIRKVGGV